MIRSKQLARNNRVIQRVTKMVREHGGFAHPSYKLATGRLNSEQLFINWRNTWTSKSLFRMLQRTGIRVLHGIVRALENRNS